MRHFADHDTTYKGYATPKGTAAAGNTAAIYFDPVRYPDPFHFKPECYINHTKRAAEYAAMADPYAHDHFIFGSGRRICPGSRFAENALTLTLALANMLRAFELRPPPMAEEGKETYRDAVINLSDDAFN